MSLDPNTIRCETFLGHDRPELLTLIEALRLKEWDHVVGPEHSAQRFGLDRFDGQAWHIVHLSNHAAIASGRLYCCDARADVPDRQSFGPYLDRMGFPAGFLNRLVVDEQYRNRGFGTHIDAARIQLARQRSQKALWVEAEQWRVPHLQRLGFTVIGPSMDTSIAGDWHILIKEL